MKSFDFIFPTRMRVGADRMQELGVTAREYGTHAFVVLDPFLKGSQTAASILEDLRQNGVEHTVYYDVMPNPRNTMIDEGIVLCRAAKCDVVVVVGGGSAIDTAKAIALVAVHGGTCWEYTERAGETVQRPSTPGLPLIVCPTTAGTGSETTACAVINNPSEVRKCTIINPVIYPTVSIIDPKIMLSVPPLLTALTGIDTFAHSFEAFICSGSNAISDMFALRSMELFAQNIRTAVQNGSDVEARSQLAMSCAMGGAALFNAGVCLPHALGQPLSAFTDAPHGGTLAACLPQVIEWTLPYAQDRFARVAEIMDPMGVQGMTIEQKAYQLPKIMHALYQDLDVHVSFSGYGLKLDDLDAFIELCFTAFRQDIEKHPKPVTRENIREVLEMCM